ncbi:hypothetical protein [Candidatus Mycobacterium methanotrophicum]|uniref:hypothetical protein n=1 Tax=Candidatus Mycobacterium methanotrophicum TaxID=2943498 RepID=UPI003512C343
MSAPPPDYPDYPDYPSFGYGPPAYPPMGYSGYRPAGYGPPANYPPPPGYASYPPSPYPPTPGYAAPPGYGSTPPNRFPTIPSGIIPLRPLSLNDIFNGAAAYIRTNLKATLGLAAIVVVGTQIITLIGAVGPLAAANRLRTAPPDDLTEGDIAAWMMSAGLAGVVGWLAGVVLSGMLTVVVGRAVFGSTIGPAETWVKIRARLPALIGLVAVESVGLVLLVGLVGLIIGAVGAAGNAAAAVVIGLPLLLVSIATVVFFYTTLSFAPVLIVLERLPVIDAITRSFKLVRNSFWRVLGIRVLTWVVVVLIANALAAPFNFVGALLVGSSGSSLLGATVGAVGSAIGRIITAPFSAGVVVLLYTDRRIRAEAFDLVLQSGAGRPAQSRPAASTDYLWLTRPV